MSTIAIHPSVDHGVKPGMSAFAGGTLTCHCAQAPLVVTIKGDVAHNHACDCTKCWKPKGQCPRWPRSCHASGSH